MKLIFEDIAKKVDGELFIKDEIVSMGMGVRSPYTVYSITLDYKGIRMTVHNQVGTTSIGTITCLLPTNCNIPSFNFETRSNFSTLFFGKKNRFKIECKDEKIKKFLRNCIEEPVLMKYMKENQFEPCIFYKSGADTKAIITEYNLLFEEWPMVIVPVINLNKKIIDYLILSEKE